MIYLALWITTAIAVAAIFSAIANARKAREAREAGFVFGFTAGVETALETVKGAQQGQVVDPVHRAAQLEAARRGLQ